MKSFVCNILNKLKSKSETIDAQSILGEKAWIIFNDEGEKETLIFQPDGELILSLNGVTYSGKWRFISANKTVQLQYEGEKTGLMLHPSFKDDYLFALQVDGTEKYAFLIDEGNADACKFKTLSDITNHFKEIEEAKELALIASENAKKRKEIEQKEQELQRQIEVQKEREAAYQQKREEEAKIREEERINDSEEIDKFLEELKFWKSQQGKDLQKKIKNIKKSAVYNLCRFIDKFNIVICVFALSVMIVCTILYMLSILELKVTTWILIPSIGAMLVACCNLDFLGSLTNKYLVKLRKEYKGDYFDFYFDKEYIDYLIDFSVEEDLTEEIESHLAVYLKEYGEDSFYISSQSKFENLKNKQDTD